MSKISFKCKEKKRKEIVERKREEEGCHENQQNAQNQGLCCHEHVKLMKKERNESIRKKKVQVNRPDHCIHCDEDPCVFIQIETRLKENGVIYYDESEYMQKIMWHTTVLDASMCFSMLQCLFYGRGSTTTRSPTMPVLRMASVRFSLP
jgi:hypothetical protein